MPVPQCSVQNPLICRPISSSSPVSPARLVRKPKAKRPARSRPLHPPLCTPIPCQCSPQPVDARLVSLPSRPRSRCITSRRSLQWPAPKATHSIRPIAFAGLLGRGSWGVPSTVTPCHQPRGPGYRSGLHQRRHPPHPWSVARHGPFFASCSRVFAQPGGQRIRQMRGYPAAWS